SCFCSSRRRHTRSKRDWSSDVCSSDLTGSNQHVGNFPGVTVEGKEGTVRGHDDLVVVDLPGIYALSPYTAEEIVARDFILEQQQIGRASGRERGEAWGAVGGAEREEIA